MRDYYQPILLNPRSWERGYNAPQATTLPVWGRG